MPAKYLEQITARGFWPKFIVAREFIPKIREVEIPEVPSNTAPNAPIPMEIPDVTINAAPQTPESSHTAGSSNL